MGVKTRKLGNIDTQIIEWQSVFTGDGSTGLTAVAGRGYFIDTTSGTVTVTLPASPSIGDQIAFKDFARTFGTNNVTLASNTFDGVASTTHIFSTSGLSATCIYSGNGWQLINDDTTTKMGPSYIEATGGTVTTSGDFKIHTFTGDGCFVVSDAGSPAGSNTVDYLVVAGGGGGGTDGGGGGGAGGYRASGFGPSPLQGSALNLALGSYSVTVGAGGAGAGGASEPAGDYGSDGSDSVLDSITSTGGGGGARQTDPGNPGGSGGGGGGNSGGGPAAGGSGNTPPVSPPQGNDGGTGLGGAPNYGAGGGGGAGGAGGNGSGPSGGAGGSTVPNAILGPASNYAGGGAGAIYNSGPGTSGGANTGTGGDGGSPDPANAGDGGSGIVVVRVPSDFTLSGTPGPAFTGSTHPGGDKIGKFTASGTLTIGGT